MQQPDAFSYQSHVFHNDLALGARKKERTKLAVKNYRIVKAISNLSFLLCSECFVICKSVIRTNLKVYVTILKSIGIFGPTVLHQQLNK